MKRIVSSPYFRYGVGLAISALCVYLAIRNVNLRDVQTAILRARPGYVVLGLVSVGVNLTAKILRWDVLLGVARRKVSVYKLTLSFIFAQMLNAFLPARVGEISRVAVIGEGDTGYAFVLGTIAMEKVLDMIAYATLLMVLLLFLPLPEWVGNSGYAFIGLTILVSLGVVLVSAQRTRVIKALDWFTARGHFPERWRTFITTNLRDGLASLDVFYSRVNVLKLAVCSAIIWGTAVLTNYLILLAFDIQLPFEAVLLILVVLQAGISIPAVPGKIGVFEYACVLSLLAFGIQTPISLSYGILLHAIVYLPIVLLGLVSFWFLQLESTNRRFVEK